jgi:Zn/Cd-binding protein ZinT
MREKKIVLEPWKSYYNNIHSHDIRVLVGTDKQFAIIIADPENERNTWCYRYKGDNLLNWSKTKYRRDQLDECRAEVDRKLIEQGYLLLTDEQYEKLAILI